MSDQQPLRAGERVEVHGDRRRWLNGKRGVVLWIIGDIVEIKFDVMLGRTDCARVLLEHLKKVEE